MSEILAKELGALSFAAIARAQQPFSPHPVSAPGVSSERSAALLLGTTNIISGYFTASNGKLSITAIEENVATGKTIRSFTADGDILSAADSLARQFTSSAKPFATRNGTAVRLYALGLESQGANAFRNFEQATNRDPAFGDAYLAWTRAAAAAGDRAELEHALAAGQAHAASLQPLDRAFLELDAATLHQNTPARIDALTTITKLSPDSAGELRALAEAETSLRRFQPAIGHYQQALALRPDDADIRNLLSYTKMFAGDYAGALNSVREYQKLKPDDPNAIDSEGDIHFYFGKFADAERLYLASFAKNASFDAGVDAWKAARARLMTGDVAGATQLFQKYHDARAKADDATLAFRDAKWQYLTGDRTAGIATMIAAAEAAKNPEIRAACFTQAAIWELSAGQTQSANKHSTTALQLGNTQSLINAAIAHFLAQPPATAAEWRARAEHSINGAGAEQVRRLATAYAYLLSRQFTDAAAVWKTIYEGDNPNDQGTGFLYAWALVETGQAAQAAPILKTNPIPGPLPSANFENLYFPALFAWRGDRETFTKLGGTPAPAK